MARNRVSRRVARKELGLFFASPVAWLFLASFAAVTLFIFFWAESFFARNIADVRPLFEWMPVLLIFLCAALTMRMWSEERRTGTLEYVLTQPVSLWRFALGKFRACFALLLLALLATASLPVTVALIAELDWGPVIAGYLASALLGAAYLSAGLFVSSRTDNPIVSLIGTVALCGLLYLAGSPALTDFFDNRAGELLRLLGSGARFDSITRGVLDVRDLFYYLSLTAAFLTLNVFTLEKERWARGRHSPRHRLWRGVTALLLANLVLANVWLHGLPRLRLDVTHGHIYTLSGTSRELLDQLQEPLLLRGYFSAKTHPLLAPLVPQLRDLLHEYEVAGGGKVRVEWVDPASDPQLEEEANQQYGILANHFQVADRYQSALVNSYFSLLVRYGSEHETLGFADLIEVRELSQAPPEVRLRNPEFDITRAIREVLYRYRSGGSLFDRIDHAVEFIGYVSADERLPPALADYRREITRELDRVVAESGGRFSVRFIEPEARGGSVAQKISDTWGFRPMVAALGDEREFFFYLTLADPEQVVQLPTAQFDASRFRATLETGLKRFASGFTRTVALAVPEVQPEMARFHLGGPTFVNLERNLAREYNLRMADLESGEVAAEADILVVMAPHNLSSREVFALDQFLMRGGTVIMATGPYTAELAGGEMTLQDWDSGLQDWLQHLGISIGETLVLDERNAPFPAPVARRAGEYEFRDVQVIDYPYFLDLRGDGLAEGHPVTAGLPQLTMAWASPIEVTPAEGRRPTTLLRSSPRSWLSQSMEIMPADGGSFEAAEARGSQPVGIVLQGRFESWFAHREPPGGTQGSEAAGPGEVSGMVTQSPESARLVLFSSNDFLDDQVLGATVAASGTRYSGGLELLLNTLDWALQDEQLLQIRSRGHFNRTLPPMERRAQAAIEYFNYGLAVSWLLLLAAGYFLRRYLRRRRYARGLAL